MRNRARGAASLIFILIVCDLFVSYFFLSMESSTKKVIALFDVDGTLSESRKVGQSAK